MPYRVNELLPFGRRKEQDILGLAGVTNAHVGVEGLNLYAMILTDAPTASKPRLLQFLRFQCIPFNRGDQGAGLPAAHDILPYKI